ncbi:MAG: flagellar brake protein [Bdellovibrionia bacterium]
MSGSTFFKKVHVSERKRLFARLAEKGSYIFCRKDENKFTFKAELYFEEEKVLKVKRVEAQQDIEFGEALFQFEDEKNQYYFSTTLIKQDNDEYMIHGDTDLFVLQRRSSARIDIPSAHSSIFKIIKLNNQDVHLDARVLDVSAGGAKLTLKVTLYPIKNGDKLKGSLRLGNRTPIDLEVEVRFVAQEEENKGYTFGVKFLKVNSVLENKIMTILMNLHNELRRAGKNKIS